MSEIENLINDLQKQVAKLQEELAISDKNIKDFEITAHSWKKGYDDLKSKYVIELGNANQTISQLEDEIEDLKDRQYGGD